MALYMYQASYTAKSMAAQLRQPQDPMEAIRPAMEDVGAKVLVAGFPFGEYDVLIVYEAADDVTAASVAMAVAAAGEVKSAKTTRVLSGQEWLDSLRKRRIVTRKVRQPQPELSSPRVSPPARWQAGVCASRTPRQSSRSRSQRVCRADGGPVTRRPLSACPGSRPGSPPTSAIGS